MKIRKPPKKIFLGVFYVLAFALALILVLHQNPFADQLSEIRKKVSGCILLGALCILVTLWYEKLTVLPVELFQSRKLIKRLAVNDFKKRYAGSAMGIVWALAQPVVTVALYYVVFGVIFKQHDTVCQNGGAIVGASGNARGAATSAIDVPQVLFLTAGLVPWFFFSEALTNGTTALLEYNYLVKKVLFKISILPIIKIIAAMFMHIFFLSILLILACGYGFYPSIYWIQIPYYMACEFILVLSLSYFTSAIVVFFRDLLQIINIGLQVFMWGTPILWNMESIPFISENNLQWVFKLNPMTIIVEGFRNSIYGETWFYEDFYSSTYFWLVVLGLFCFGAVTFKRLKPHFADVL